MSYKGKLNLSSETVAIVDGKLWVSDISSNKIYEYDLVAHKMKTILAISEERDEGERLFSDIVVCEDKIFLIPFNAENMYEVNAISREYKIISIPFSKDIRAKFGNGFWYNDSIWLTGINYKGIIKYCYRTCDIEIFDKWILEENSFRIPLFRRCSIYNNILYAASYSGGSLLVFDLDKETYLIKSIRSSRKGFIAVSATQEGLFLIDVSGKELLRIDIDTDECFNIELDLPAGMSFANVVYDKGHVYILPIFGNAIIDIDAKSSRYSFVDTGCSKWFTHFYYGDELFFLDVEYGCIFRIEDNELKQVNRLFLQGKLTDRIKKNECVVSILYENERDTLCDYVFSL